jgi:hypothetical protein
VSERRRFLAIVVLFLIGWGMLALADALDAWWPLFLTPLPYAAIPYLVVHADDRKVPSVPSPDVPSAPSPAA